MIYIERGMRLSCLHVPNALSWVPSLLRSLSTVRVLSRRVENGDTQFSILWRESFAHNHECKSSHTSHRGANKSLMGPTYTLGTERCLQCRRWGEGWELEISAVAGSKDSQWETSSLPVRA